MTHSALRAAVAVVAVSLSAIAGCSRPDPNPAIRVTGDPDAAVPPTTATTTTTTSVTTTTLYYSVDRTVDGG